VVAFIVAAGFDLEQIKLKKWSRQETSCSVPRFFRELSPNGLVVNREAAPRSCMVVLSSWAVEVCPNWGAGIFGV
jgi:hypothetical protein